MSNSRGYFMKDEESMMKRRMVAWLAALALLCAIGHVARAEDYPALRKKDTLKIGYTVPDLTNESHIRNYNQVVAECKKRGWELIQDTNATYEGDKTRTSFQRILSQDPDAIILAYPDIPPINDLIIEARRKGVGVYSIGGDLAEGIVLHTESAPAVIAAKIMTYAIQRMNGTGDVSGFIELWMPRGFRRDIVAATLIEDGRWDFGPTEHHKLTPEGYTDEIFRVTSNWLTKYGNRMDFIWACWDLGAITIARAMAEKGFTKDDMFSVGIDGGSMSWSIIREGKIPFVASLAEPFEYMVHSTMEAIKQAHVDGVQPGDRNSLIPPTRYITPDNYCVIIDENNVPAIGTNIHAVFNYYGGNPDDKDAWYNWGEPYLVKESIE